MVNELNYIEIKLSVDELKNYGILNNNLLNCNFCDQIFKNTNALRMHLVKTHNFIKSFSDIKLRHRLKKNSLKGYLLNFLFEK